jgi:hypothetical protein
LVRSPSFANIGGAVKLVGKGVFLLAAMGTRWDDVVDDVVVIPVFSLFSREKMGHKCGYQYFHARISSDTLL